jgi:hypothetical protein
MKAGLAVFIFLLLHASASLAQGIAPNATGAAKPPAVINTPGVFQNSPGAFQQFSRPAAPSALVSPMTPGASSDESQLRAHQFQQQAKQVKKLEADAKDKYGQSQEQFKKALGTITEHEERTTSATSKTFSQ